jgi:hypothetical protein
MGLINGLVLIVLGGLCIPGIIAKKNDKAKELLEKIIPIQGTIGLIVFVWGIWGIVSSILSLGILGSWPVSWFTSLVGSIISFAGGAIVGWGMIQQKLLASANQETKEKASEVYKKLITFQEKIGIIAIITGLWTIIYSLILQNIIKL